jgi:steroid delta-isomerase-like uncharacterized protein
MEGAENLDLLRRAMRASTKGDQQAFAETHTDDVVVYANGILAGRGRDQLMAYWKRWFGPFPDLRLRPTDLMVDRERIFFDAQMEGTHTGTLRLPGGRTYAATGRSFSTPIVVHFRIRDGRLAEVREFINADEIVRQLGLNDERSSAESGT